MVLDTNILLVSISRRSPYHWVFQKLIEGAYQLSVTTEILSEYSEIIEKHMGKKVADPVLQALLELPNVEKIEIYFRWNLIKDMDDNKFIDCAVAAGADYLVTQDKDFNILEKIEFPIIKSISIAEFKRLLL
ncbi:putative toxin-antitoxin system toxin component, PIN family [Cyclobacterium jeungdonense]|uniref:Toxin-antitoxin system toxin component, PIN family n=1 Tax=Cyclobacterium jeungdonense TaxID=708087 RepID=A0ABT8C9J0_9BACT|nr:putative toxin-antitoxin system toxin component, PIN family [Cyclobacterium jeungdonense]MDN3689469.1 putative toxin-antitoxin system toxin component, PIN family [Cyclobacterium jeungdonense]